MNRREFMTAGGATAVGLGASLPPAAAAEPDYSKPRTLFPRLAHDSYINAARGTPLSTFSARGLERFQDYWRYGPGDGRYEYFEQMWDEIQGDFARLIGAKASEIALVECTKSGERIVIDGLPKLRAGGNLVTNDYHYPGSLHSYVGMQRAGLDVRIVKSRDWRVDFDAMDDAIDEKTELVTLTLVSNVNGRIEDAARIAEMAHRKGALVYADIIQAAGAIPVDVRELGIDFAACSGYKWMYGLHGAGFLYVREDLQGKELEDRWYPGHALPNYRPWTPQPVGEELYPYHAPEDASRYQPGNPNYNGFCALWEGLRFIHTMGVDHLLRHSVELNRHLLTEIDLDRYPSVSPDVERSPILTLSSRDNEALAPRLEKAGVTVTLPKGLIRISPAIYNTVEDMDRLAEVLSA